MQLIKLFYENFKHYPSTGAVILTAVAYYLNQNSQVIPKEYADLILMAVTVFVGTFLVGKQTLTK